MREDLNLLYKRELKYMCRERYIPVSQGRSELINALIAWRPPYVSSIVGVEDMNKARLKELCRERNIACSHLNKGQMVYKLQNWRNRISYTRPKTIREACRPRNAPPMWKVFYNKRCNAAAFAVANAKKYDSSCTHARLASFCPTKWIEVVYNQPMRTLDYVNSLIKFHEAKYNKYQAEWLASRAGDPTWMIEAWMPAQEHNAKYWALVHARNLMQQINDPHFPGGPQDKLIGGYRIPVGGWVWKTIVYYSPSFLTDASDYMNCATLDLHRIANSTVPDVTVLRKRARDDSDDE